MEKIAENLVNAINDMGHDVAPFVDKVVLRTHRTLQQSIFGLVVKLIYKWAEMADTGLYDLRNEYTCTMCAKLRDVLQDGCGDRTPFI